MTHEPECPNQGFSLAQCLACDALRAAYQRGRKDAAIAVGSNNVQDLAESGEGIIVQVSIGKNQRNVYVNWEKAISLARGDGEQV